MEVTFLGNDCVRLRGHDVQVVVDPSEQAMRQLARSRPEVVVRTEGSTDPERLRPAEGRAQEVGGPGEFELRGVRVHGLAAGGGRTVMRIELDEVAVVALGRLERPLTEEEIDALGGVDLLVVPVGEAAALTPTAASKLVNEITPAVAVPVGHAQGYQPGTSDAAIDVFAKEMGVAEGWSLQPKLTLSSSSGGAAEETRVVILEPRG